MTEENGNGVSKVGKWVKVAVGILTVIAIISGGVWKLTDTFAFKAEVDKQFLLAEEQTVKTFQGVQEQLMKFDYRTDIKFYDRELENLNKQLVEVERKLAFNPNDADLKANKTSILDSIDKITQKRKDLFNKLMG
jgi:hypothetical protein